MAALLLTMAALVECAHGGAASPSLTDARITISGQPVVTLPGDYLVSRCPLPPAAGGPCRTARFVTAATRLRATGRPLLLADGRAVCAPTGAPLLVLETQRRVTGI